MTLPLQALGELVRASRNDRHISQQQLADALVPATNRSLIAHLEQGRRVPPANVLERICQHLGVSERHWRPFTDPSHLLRLAFEESLAELIGRRVSLPQDDDTAIRVVQDAINRMFGAPQAPHQIFTALNSLLVHYGIRQLSWPFFDRFLSTDSTLSIANFQAAVSRYQVVAIRLFSTFAQAFQSMNLTPDLATMLLPLAPNDVAGYRLRAKWDCIESIPENRLADLGYISAQRARKEAEERALVATFLEALAADVAVHGRAALSRHSDKRLRTMASLLRKFEAPLDHDLMSPLFLPDADAILRIAAAVAPKDSADLDKMAATQAQAERNMTRYLSADYMDVYVATSMRTDADYVSINRFVASLFDHAEVRALNLRHFDPTQSWSDDRVAKGLLEALMLRRASLAIYLAQKTDSFGKDSEASVALGQGKSVIVYVPALRAAVAGIDSEQLGGLSRADLHALLLKDGNGEDDTDDTMDRESLLGQILTGRLRKLSADALTSVVMEHWADFDLYGEDHHVPESERADYRSWLDAMVRASGSVKVSEHLREHVIAILVAVTIRFEARAKLFREQHPLALQIVLHNGILNGILVARSVSSCANLVSRVIRNELEVELAPDERNYRLIERSTSSVVRVIAKNELISNAFAAFYGPIAVA